MAYLGDTNLLLRSAEQGHPMQAVAQDALVALRASGESVCLVPQNLVEFWAVTTRPIERNGLGMTAVEAEAELVRLEGFFPVLPDTAAIHAEWRRLVTTHQITGLRVHDTRLVAAMIAHGLTHILTFNPDDFRRYAEITVVTPEEVLSRAPTE
jgi:predicted nucleic acid-binding protein